MIEEKLIQFIWQHQLFDVSNLKTIHDESINVIKNGFLNEYDGPDFSDARLTIGSIEWVGTVEIHVRDIDWLKHGHQADKNYQSVILHVVWEVNDKEAVPKDIPCLILKDYVNPNLLETYRSLMNSSETLACDSYISSMNSMDLIYAIEEKSYLRLRRKSIVSKQKLDAFDGDWQQLLFWMFAVALGKKANKEAMELVVDSIKMKNLQKHSDNLFDIESMLFGVSGLLESEDEYGTSLQKEYDFLSKKYNLNSLNVTSWNFSKVRGASKPHISIAILSVIVYSIQKIDDLKFIDSDFFNQINLSNYWTNNYKFGQKSKRKNTISQGLIDHLKINVIVPYLNTLGSYYNDNNYFEQAQEVLESIKPEKNSIIDKFIKRSFKLMNSYQSQGALELYNEYCVSRKCLNCQIGKKILNKA